MSEIDVLYICDYGQSGFNICPLMDEKCDKKDSCNLRAVVPYKQLQQAKQENEELKKKKEENTTFYLKKYANKDSECLELQHKVNILKQCLDEIEQIAKNGIKDDCGMPLDELSIILKIIKQAKKGE